MARPARPTTEADFVKAYGDSPVTLGAAPPVSLRAALAMEAAFCPADETRRRDPAKRLGYLARLVGEEALLPQHRHLLPPDEGAPD